jgi:hypothetical protein
MANSICPHPEPVEGRTAINPAHLDRTRALHDPPGVCGPETNATSGQGMTNEHVVEFSGMVIELLPEGRIAFRAR